MPVDNGPGYVGQAMPVNNGPSYAGQVMPVDNGPGYVGRAGPVDNGPSYAGQAMPVDNGPGYVGRAMPVGNGPSYAGQAMLVNNDIRMSKSEAGTLLVTASLACVAGAAGGLILASMWIMFAQVCASTIVYFSLYAIPSLFLVAGVLVVLAGSVRSGIMLCLVGGLSLAFTLMCWTRYIPFTIEVLQMVSTAFSQNSEMVAISAVGGLLGPAWFILVVLGYAACLLNSSGGSVGDGSAERAGGLGYLFIFVLTWGSGVIQNVCHVAYSGVFSRWYFEQRESPLASSLYVATVTSFGSICFGTLILAAAKTAEAGARGVRREAEEDGNMVACVIALVVECAIACIGDLVDYLSQWVFVMCALRGGSFCDSARGTCALFSCAGMKAVIGDLLIDRVETLGCLLAALGGMGLAALAALAGASPAGSMSRADVIGLCAMLGLLSALVSGAGVMAVLSSGTKAILMCWAEDPDRLHERGFEDLHVELKSKAREFNGFVENKPQTPQMSQTPQTRRFFLW